MTKTMAAKWIFQSLSHARTHVNHVSMLHAAVYAGKPTNELRPDPDSILLALINELATPKNMLPNGSFSTKSERRRRRRTTIINQCRRARSLGPAGGGGGSSALWSASPIISRRGTRRASASSGAAGEPNGNHNHELRAIQ